MIDLRSDLPLPFRGPVTAADSEWFFNQAKSQAGQELFVIAMTQGRCNGTWLEIGCGDPIRSNNTYLLEKKLGWTGISIDLERMDQDIETPFEEYWSGFYQANRRSDWPAECSFPVPVEYLECFQTNPYFENFIWRQMSDIDQIPRDQRNWATARPGTNFCQTDALTFDYDQVPDYVDYLQIDVDPSLLNLQTLQLILPRHRFGVITFEHDAWDGTRESEWVREQSRITLQQQGYIMIVSDVTVPPGHGNGLRGEPINFEDWWVDPAVIPESIWSVYQNLDDEQNAKYYHDLLFTAA